MRVGLDHYTISHRGYSPRETLDFVKGLGLEGVQFLEPAAVVPDRSTDGLERLRSQAQEHGLYLEVGLPSPNPVRASRLAGREISAQEHASTLAADVEAAARLGVRHVRAYVGDRHDRFRADTPWKHQIDASLQVIRLLSASLRSHGVKIAIETHADFTVAELLRFIDALGTDLAGVTLDTGNLLMRLEDPLRATERLAPLVLATHIKDVVLERTPRGLAWQARPIGDGVVPIREIVALLYGHHPDLNLSIELHPRTYDLPTLDPTWLAHFPEIDKEALARVEAYAEHCEALYNNKEGNHPRPAVIEAIPWADRDQIWIEKSTQALKAIVAELRLNASAGEPGIDQAHVG